MVKYSCNNCDYECMIQDKKMIKNMPDKEIADIFFKVIYNKSNDYNKNIMCRCNYCEEYFCVSCLTSQTNLCLSLDENKKTFICNNCSKDCMMLYEKDDGYLKKNLHIYDAYYRLIDYIVQRVDFKKAKEKRLKMMEVKMIEENIKNEMKMKIEEQIKNKNNIDINELFQ